MHVALRFAYDGTFPNGYARQPEGGTVEDAMVAALAEEGYVDGSWRTGSRTDRGVAALENVARAELDRPHLTGLVPAVQSRLPPDVWLTGVAQVAPDWNPRHAKARRYAYTVPRRGEQLAAMQEAARRFIGTHDVSAFARVDERHPERSITHFEVLPYGDAWGFRVQGPSFLWNQVRRMVGAVLAVGAGKVDADAVTGALTSGRAHGAFQMAPAEGLLLERVLYDPEPAWVEAGVLPQRPLLLARTQTARRARVLEHMVRFSGSS